MSNPTLEITIHENLDPKRMREEPDAEISVLKDSIKASMGEGGLARHRSPLCQEAPARRFSGNQEPEHLPQRLGKLTSNE